MQNFHEYVNIHFNKATPEYEYLNGYTTASMCITKCNDIKNERKNWLINNYTNYKFDNEIATYYDTNITDKYNHIFNPPVSLYCEWYREPSEKSDDIDDHYHNICNNYSRISSMCKQNKEDVSNDGYISYNDYDSDVSFETHYTTESDFTCYTYDDYEENEYFEEDYDY